MTLQNANILEMEHLKRRCFKFQSRIEGTKGKDDADGLYLRFLWK